MNCQKQAVISDYFRINRNRPNVKPAWMEPLALRMGQYVSFRR